MQACTYSQRIGFCNFQVIVRIDITLRRYMYIDTKLSLSPGRCHSQTLHKAPVKLTIRFIIMCGGWGQKCYTQVHIHLHIRLPLRLQVNMHCEARKASAEMCILCHLPTSRAPRRSDTISSPRRRLPTGGSPAGEPIRLVPFAFTEEDSAWQSAKRVGLSRLYYKFPKRNA